MEDLDRSRERLQEWEHRLKRWEEANKAVERGFKSSRTLNAWIFVLGIVLLILGTYVIVRDYQDRVTFPVIVGIVGLLGGGCAILSSLTFSAKVSRQEQEQKRASQRLEQSKMEKQQAEERYQQLLERRQQQQPLPEVKAEVQANAPSNRRVAPGLLSPREQEELRRSVDEANSVTPEERAQSAMPAYLIRGLREATQSLRREQTKGRYIERRLHRIEFFHMMWRDLIRKEEWLREAAEQVRKYEEFYTGEGGQTEPVILREEAQLQEEQRDAFIAGLWDEMQYLTRWPRDSDAWLNESIAEEWSRREAQLQEKLQEWRQELEVWEDYYKTRVETFEERARVERRSEYFKEVTAEKREELRRWREQYQV